MPAVACLPLTDCLLNPLGDRCSVFNEINYYYRNDAISEIISSSRKMKIKLKLGLRR